MSEEAKTYAYAYNVGHFWCEDCQRETRLEDEAHLYDGEDVECEHCEKIYTLDNN